MADSPLHPSVVALVSLAASIAANHPKKGLCQIDRLRGHGIAEEQIDMVVEIARHLRDEAGEMLDAAFNEEAKLAAAPAAAPPAPTFVRCVPAETVASEPAQTACCTPTAKGGSCC